MTRFPQTALFAASLLLVSALSARAELITNGDFETGDLSGWTNTAGATAVSGGSALDGTTSAQLPGGTILEGSLRQTFAAQTSPTSTTFLFAMTEPGGGDRGLNTFWGEGGDSGQINLRVVELSAGTGGDVQIFQSGGPSWQTILTDVVTFSSVLTTPVTNSLKLNINDYGASFDYDVTVNGTTAAGLSFFQNSPVDNLDELIFNNDFGATAFTVDNVSIVPEPGALTLLLLGLAGLGITRRRRRRA